MEVTSSGRIISLAIHLWGKLCVHRRICIFSWVSETFCIQSRVYAPPDMRRYQDTKIRRKSCNPSYGEHLQFDVSWCLITIVLTPPPGAKVGNRWWLATCRVACRCIDETTRSNRHGSISTRRLYAMQEDETDCMARFESNEIGRGRCPYQIIDIQLL